MHLKKFEILIPIRRNRAVAADVFEVADPVEDSFPGRRHLVGIEALLPKQTVDRPRCHRG